MIYFISGMSSPREARSVDIKILVLPLRNLHRARFPFVLFHAAVEELVVYLLIPKIITDFFGSFPEVTKYENGSLVQFTK